MCCKWRFGVTGIHFEDFEPNVPCEMYTRSLVAISPQLKGKPSGGVVSLADLEEAKIVTTPPTAAFTAGCGETPNKSTMKKKKEQHIPIFEDSPCSSTSSDGSTSWSGSSPSSESTSPPSPYSICLSSSSTGLRKHSRQALRPLQLSTGAHHSQKVCLLSDGRQVSTPTGKENYHKALKSLSKAQKLEVSTPQKYRKDSSDVKNPTTSAKGVKAPPRKEVRFSTEVQKRTLPSETPDSSSDISDDSYIDPPPPLETNTINHNSNDDAGRAGKILNTEFSHHPRVSDVSSRKGEAGKSPKGRVWHSTTASKSDNGDTESPQYKALGYQPQPRSATRLSKQAPEAKARSRPPKLEPILVLRPVHRKAKKVSINESIETLNLDDDGGLKGNSLKRSSPSQAITPDDSMLRYRPLPIAAEGLEGDLQYDEALDLPFRDV